MAGNDRFDDSIGRWLQETAPDRLPQRVLSAAFERTRGSRQQVGWGALLRRPQLTRFVPALGGAAVVVLAAVALGVYVNQPGIGVSTIPPPAVTPSPASPPPSPAPSPETTAPSPEATERAVPSIDTEVNELLTGFIEARVAGAGAGSFLDGPSDDVPLLYATSSGAPYERGEFEPVAGIEVPDGRTAFRVRLFAGDTEVEQHFFASPSGPRGLEYQSDRFRTDFAPTTEDGLPLMGEAEEFLDGEVTIQLAHPWVAFGLIPEGAGPFTDGPQRAKMRRLLVMAVPEDCQPRRPANAEAVAESILSEPDLEATAPVAVSAGGADALMMDVVTADRPGACASRVWVGDGGSGDMRMRLYLIDAPEGSSMRVLAVAIIVPESGFARAVAPMARMLDTLQFHAPTSPETTEPAVSSISLTYEGWRSGWFECGTCLAFRPGF